MVLCLRDPKDVLISQYWSWKRTHFNNTPNILEARHRLNALSMKEGLLFLIEQRLLSFCDAVQTWVPDIASGAAMALRHKHLLEDFANAMRPTASIRWLLSQRCQLAARQWPRGSRLF